MEEEDLRRLGAIELELSGLECGCNGFGLICTLAIRLEEKGQRGGRERGEEIVEKSAWERKEDKKRTWFFFDITCLSNPRYFPTSALLEPLFEMEKLSEMSAIEKKGYNQKPPRGRGVTGGIQDDWTGRTLTLAWLDCEKVYLGSQPSNLCVGASRAFPKRL